MPHDAFRFSGRGLSFAREGKRIFSNIDFTIEQSEALIITGSNGSGKTSLLSVIAGIKRQEKGDLFWDGQVILPNKFHNQIAYVGHEVFLKPILTLYENLSFWAGLYGIKIDQKALLEKIGLSGLENYLVEHLSYGQKRRALLSIMFLKPKAKIWILDEPAQGFDSQARTMLARLVMRHREEGGAAIIATHQVLHIPESQQMDMSDV